MSNTNPGEGETVQRDDYWKTPTKRVTNLAPKFGISEGTRLELETHGKAVDPFTGAPMVGTGKPGSKPRQVTAPEYVAAKDKVIDAPLQPDADAKNTGPDRSPKGK